MNNTCAGPPTRNQVSGASGSLPSSRPRSFGSRDLSEGTMSGNVIGADVNHSYSQGAISAPSGAHCAAGTARGVEKAQCACVYCALPTYRNIFLLEVNNLDSDSLPCHGGGTL